MAHISQQRWLEYDKLIEKGVGIDAAARRMGISENTARQRRKRQRPEDRAREIVEGMETVRVRPGEIIVRVAEGPGPIPYEDLSEDAQKAWNDFSYFQERYFGRLATPWQSEAAQQVVEWLANPDKTYGVINAPPGCGKSTTFTHDIPAWLTVRNRAIRGQMGSKVESSAQRYVARLKNSLTATLPVQPEDIEIQRGLAIKSVATLAGDFGVFKPPQKEDVWSQSAIVVAQMGGTLSSQKEPTWSAFGQDSGFLGMRYDLIIWDDLVDTINTASVEARAKLQHWWDSIAEKRLEPAGVLVLQGQRMGADDLYRYCLDKIGDVEDEDDGETDIDPQLEVVNDTRKYAHIVYKAHYDDRCQGLHKRTSPYYPEGCLLDPRRLTWREIKVEQKNVRNNFAVIYQQEDVDPENVLVDMKWITGGTDSKTGEVYPGCLDKDRMLWQIPRGLIGNMVYIATADPSPTMYWSIQLWGIRVVNGEPQERFLLDHIRRKLDAPGFLDWNNATQTFSGVMEDWQSRSVEERIPITTWIIEKNGAQRFLLQYEHVMRWQAKWRTRILPHNTGANKADDEFGVQMLAGIYRYGLVRLPYRSGEAFGASRHLIDEVTVWPEGRTDDTVMAQWFLELNLPKLLPVTKSLPKAPRPSWLQGTNTWAWRGNKVNA